LPREAGGTLTTRTPRSTRTVAGGITHVRAAEAETMGRLRIGYTDSEASYDDRVAEATLPGDAAERSRTSACRWR
jgi:hypothetical protein